MNSAKISSLVLLCALTVQAQLAVVVSPAKFTGQKAIVTLAMTNSLSEPIESARAVCFLLDAQGKMVGQSAKWVIGGTKDRPPLEPKSGTTFNFVISDSKSLPTSLTPQISFTVLTLNGGRQANPRTDVQVQFAK